MVKVLGDSHAEFTFKTCSNAERIMLAGRTLHRCCRDGLNLPEHGISDGDTVVLVFGEVDCRCHIRKQVDKGRQEAEIIDTLISQYANRLKEALKLMPNLKIYLATVVPPAYKSKSRINPVQPFVGTDGERLRYVRKLNGKLRNMAIKNGFQIFDVYNLYTDKNGMLDPTLSDGHVHVGKPELVESLWNTTFPH